MPSPIIFRSREPHAPWASLCLFTVLTSFIFAHQASAEGSRQVGLNQPLVEYQAGLSNQQFVDVLSVGEVINVSAIGETIATDDVRIRMFDPVGTLVVDTIVANGNILPGEQDFDGPLTTPFRHTATMTGAYEIQLINQNDDLIRLFDVSITPDAMTDPDPRVEDGRFYAFVWRFNAGSFAKTEATDADYYALVPGGFPSTNYVWKLDLNSFAGFVYSIVANQIGVDAPNSGLSTESTNNSYSPLYPVYVGYPDIALPEPSGPPTVTNFRFVDDLGRDQSISPSDSPGIEDSGFFEFDSDVDGNYSIIIDANEDGEFSLGDVFLNGVASAGANSISWDGKDNSGTTLPVGQYQARAQVRLGEYHFVADDAETSGGDEDGLTIFRALSGASEVDTLVFWDDFTLLGGSSTLPDGGLSSSPAGKHTWGDFTSGGFGNQRYIDTYVFGLAAFVTTDAVIDDDDDLLVDSDGDGIFDDFDLDDDNDGVPDGNEGAGNADGDVVVDALDLDSDDDGIADLVEAGGVDSNLDGRVDGFTDTNRDGLDDSIAGSPLPDLDSDSDSLKNRVDIDSDGDGIVDNVEGQASSSYGLPSGSDTDGDGWDNAYDSDNGGTAFLPENVDGADLVDYLDSDSDNDGVPDSIEGHDANKDGVRDTTASGSDSDGDGLDDAYDTVSGPGSGNSTGSNAPLQNTDSADERDWRDANDDNDGSDTVDEDGNSNGNWSDDDQDSDGVPDYLDPLDSDGDGVIDITDIDDDNDGITDALELAGDFDGDGYPNSLDIDSDNDGIVDNIEAQDGSTYVAPSGNDTDGDGLDNSYDPDNGGSFLTPINTDSSGQADYVDLDSDEDLVPDSIEGNDANRDGAADTTASGTDSDRDGLDDAYDTVAGPGPGNSIGSNAPLQNTDGTGERDWRDDDDDGDGVDTSEEDNNANGNFADDDEDGDSIPDYLDDDDSDGDGVPDSEDLDDDNDGIPSATEGSSDRDGDGLTDDKDIDSDSDGISDLLEAGGIDTNGDGRVDGFTDNNNDGLDDSLAGAPLPDTSSDSDGLPNRVDIDSDNDGIVDNVEAQSSGGYRAPSGGDGDFDGWDDEYDTDNGGTPFNPVNSDGTDSPDYFDSDTDNDLVPDSIEGHDANMDGAPDTTPSGSDTDGDGLDDAYDTVSGPGAGNSTGSNSPLQNTDGADERDWRDEDDDNDGIDTVDEDTNSNGNRGDDDGDGDGIPDYLDNDDADGDGVPDSVDVDDDNDGILDAVETAGDFDGDTVSNALDIDSDGDGIVDNVEAQTSASYVAPTGNDTDGDGLDDAYDPDSGGTLVVPTNTDGAGQADFLDADSDDDGVLDRVEGHDADSDGMADTTASGTDTDRDGLDDAFDTVSGPAVDNPTGSNSPLQNRDGSDERDWRDTDDDNDSVDTEDEDNNSNNDWSDDDDDGDSIPDYLDDDDRDSDGVPDSEDLDSDNDGLPDSLEGSGDSDGDGVRDSFDLDSDNDGLGDITEAGGSDSNLNGRVDGFTDSNGDGLDDGIAGSPLPDTNSDSDAIPNRLDIDSDQDGVVDNVEGQLSGTYVPPSGGDTDEDGWDDAYDGDNGGTAFSPANSDGVDEPDYLDDDSDEDGVPDRIEGHDANMDGVSDTSLAGSDGDGDGLDDAYDSVEGPAPGNSTGSNAPLQNTDTSDERDFRDIDDDNDGISTDDEDANSNGDWSDDDDDGDGRPNYLDNDDSDNDGIGDGLDLDDDNDGIPDVDEGNGSLDSDSDGVADSKDLDSDNDGTPDLVEAGGVDSDQDGRVDSFIDSNGDGLHDPYASNPLPRPDSDGDGLADSLDLDSDDDGLVDLVEAGSVDTDGNGRVDSFTDDSGDGWDDSIAANGLEDPDTDSDSRKDRLDIDSDGDGIVDNVEGQNSSSTVVPSGLDTDADGWDDAYDSDNGGTSFVPSNSDGSGNPDYQDTDSDQDGVADSIEGHDANRDGAPDVSPRGNDTDGDGLDDAYDNVSGPGPGNSTGSNAPLQNSDGFDERDWRDTDDDNDDVPTSIEDENWNGNRTDDDANGDGTPNFLDVTAALLELEKTAQDLNGAPLSAGDLIEYTLIVRNLTTESAINSRLQDFMPANTTYVPDSTRRNHKQLSDVGGQSPLVEGLSIRTNGEPQGTIAAGGSVTFRFQVSVDESAVDGTQIHNRASLSSGISSSSATFVEPSDNPDTSLDDDPTSSTVGSSPALSVAKAAVDINGAPFLQGETLVYQIRVMNTGTTESSSVVIKDLIPENGTYVSGSMTLDPDGPGPELEASLTDASDDDAGDFDISSSGAVSVQLSSLEAGSEALFTFAFELSSGAADGETVSNQAIVASTELPDVLSDSDGDPRNGSQPTAIVVGSEPALQFSKSVADTNGGTTIAGDQLEYEISLTNYGAANATNLTVLDPIPPIGTEYVANSTTQDGVALDDDTGSVSPLSSGIALSSLEPGETIRWTARVRINEGLSEGTVVSNQASYTADGGLSGVSDSDLDDGVESGNDASNPNDDDPTELSLGGAPGSATLSGRVWNDLNHDRTLDSDEPTVEGFIVELLQDGTLLDSTTTKADGTWQFQGIVPGSGYQVRFRDPKTGVIWGDPISDAPESRVEDGIVDDLTLRSGTVYVNLSLPLDPSGVAYDTETRMPLAGVTFEIEGPGSFDPDVHLLPGQQNQVTGDDGRYRFDLVSDFPPGVYTVSYSAPPGYLPIVPSVIIPPEQGPLDPTGMPDPFMVAPNNGAPSGDDPTTYYLEFELAAGDPNVVNNHVPLDPARTDPFTVVKTTSKNRASMGEMVPFTIRVTNNLAGTVEGVRVADILPPGFKYVEGSAQVDRVLTEPDVGTNPLELFWTGLDFAPNQERVVSLIAVIGTGVQRGIFRNRALVQDESATLLSNIAEATVLVVPDPLFDQSDIIGKVFEDRNRNGYQDEGEPGVPGVTLATVRGLRTTTDEFGRYHVVRPEDPTPTIGSNFILKADPKTLPMGYTFTTENPRVIRLTTGRVHKINFGIAPSDDADDAPLIVLPSSQGAKVSGDDSSEEAGFSESGASPIGAQRREGLPTTICANAKTVDGALDPLDIQIRADSKAGEPVLNVVALPDVVGPDQVVRFVGYSDYKRWIEYAEVRVFPVSKSTRSNPVATIPLIEFTARGASWRSRELQSGVYTYILRVYHKSGVFDETGPKELEIREMNPEILHKGLGEPAWAGYGENHRFLKNIDVRGAKVIVNGRDVPSGHSVLVLESEVPVDGEGLFATAEWVPFGEHEVTVSVHSGDEGFGFALKRDLYVPENEWFFVGLADLTIGTSHVRGDADPLLGEGGLIEDATGTPFEDEVYVNGRAAFYLKGVIKGEYLLTASLDTRDQSLRNIVRGLDDKDPQSVFRRIQSDEVYAVYGDDSTTVEDAPTQGKFYVRLERGESYALWGNFTSGFVGTDLAQVDRALYGVKLHWESESKTELGDDRTSVDLFAASPDTVIGREEFQGTGGSVYFLKNQDISVGSERLRVEIRDKDSGIVLEGKALIPFTDYTIDSFQGRVILTRPLPTVADDGQLISDGGLSGNPVYLVARYEYTPRFTDTDNLSVGGRGESWLNDNVKVGLTANRDEQDQDEQTLVGADITFRLSEESYLKGEIVHTEGNGFGETFSFDGGFTFGGLAQSSDERVEAEAFRVEGALGLSDLIDGASGDATAYYQHRERGFSAPGQLTAENTNQWGVRFDVPLSTMTSLRAEVDAMDVNNGLVNRGYDLDLTQKFDDHWYTTVGARRSEVRDRSSQVGAREGSRTDLAVRFGYKSGEEWDTYVFGQKTVDTSKERRDNDRGGVGASLALTDKLTLGTEVSGGDGGLGGSASADYKVSDQTNVYLNYLSSSDRSDIGTGSRNGSLAAGARSRFSDDVSVFAEERLYHGKGPSGLTHSFGLDLTPTEEWTIGSFFETGELKQPNGPDLERTSVSLNGTYDTEELRYGGAIEFRDENVTGVDRHVWVSKNNASFKLSESWRALGEFNLLRSDDSSGSFYDGEFSEALLGAAFRPIDNDRWNYLYTYRYLEDSPTGGQAAARGGDAYQQRSHVLAADVSYQATKRLELGGKYAIRASELRTEGTPWFKSTAQLAILRSNFHVVKNWDVFLEGRWTDVDLADDRTYGVLAGIYRHIGENVKLGVGYNFTDFSDDITDLSYNARGFFINIVGKF